jgi:phage-related minor tail protein
MSQEEDLQRAYRKALAEYEQARLVLKKARDYLAALRHKELEDKERLKKDKRAALRTALYQEHLAGKTYAAIGRKYGIGAQRVSMMVNYVNWRG